MCFFIFPTILSETFLIIRRIKRDIIINVLKSLYKVTVILARFLLKFDFLERFLETDSNIKFNENPSSRSRVFPYRQTVKHDEANVRLSQFCERDQP